MLGIQFRKKDVTETLNVRPCTALRLAKASSESKVENWAWSWQPESGEYGRQSCWSVPVKPARNVSQASKTLTAAASAMQREEHARLKRSHLELVIATIACHPNRQSPG